MISLALAMPEYNYEQTASAPAHIKPAVMVSHGEL